MSRKLPAAGDDKDFRDAKDTAALRRTRRDKLVKEIEDLDKEAREEKKAYRIADQERCAAAAPELLKLAPYHSGNCTDATVCHRATAITCLRCFLLLTVKHGVWHDMDFVLQLRLEEVDKEEEEA